MERYPLHKRAIVVGDSRAKGYIEALTEILYVIEVYQFPEQSHEELASYAERCLHFHHPDIIILITLLNDVVEKKIGCGNRWMPYNSKRTFSPQLALENMKFYSEKWSTLFPALTVIWTVPDVPHLTTYSAIKGSNPIKYILMKGEKEIYDKLDYMREHWKEILEPFSSTYVVSLRDLAVNVTQDKISAAIHRKYDDVSVYHRPGVYEDGINPITKPVPILADLFKKEVELILQNIREKQVQNHHEVYDNTALQSSSPSTERMPELTRNILRKLLERHEMECIAYRMDPSSHPSHDNEKTRFMEDKAKQMAFKGVYPSAEEIALEWSKYWNDKMEELLTESWKVKEKDCLDILSSSSSSEKEGRSVNYHDHQSFLSGYRKSKHFEDYRKLRKSRHRRTSDNGVIYSKYDSWSSNTDKKSYPDEGIDSLNCFEFKKPRLNSDFSSDDEMSITTAVRKFLQKMPSEHTANHRPMPNKEYSSFSSDQTVSEASENTRLPVPAAECTAKTLSNYDRPSFSSHSERPDKLDDYYDLRSYINELRSEVKSTNFDSDSSPRCKFNISKAFNTLLDIYTRKGNLRDRLKSLSTEVDERIKRGKSESVIFDSKSLKYLRSVREELLEYFDPLDNSSFIPDSILDGIRALTDLIDYNIAVEDNRYYATKMKYETSTSKSRTSSSTKILSDHKRLIDKKLGCTKYTVEELILRFGRYNSLATSERDELDRIMKDLENNNQALAASLTVLKEQSDIYSHTDAKDSV